MGAGVATVGRRLYAVGLYWENSPSGRVALAAKEAARQPGQQADFYAVRPGSQDGRVPQFGLGQISAGHKSGMPAFAACLANQQLGSWAGAFRLREGVVVTVVRDDLLVPDGDQIYLNESDARDRLLQEIGFGGLQRIYAPEAWAIPGADSMPISLLLDERRDVKLVPVVIPKKILVAAGVLVGLLLLGLAVGWYIQEKEAEEAAAQAERLAAIERAQQQARNLLPSMLQGGQPQYPPPERKWESKPQPLDVIKACQAGLAQLPAAVSGWHMTLLKCSGGSLSINWARDKGFSRPPKGATVAETAASASLVITLPPLPPRGAENLVNPSDLTHRYLAQDWPGTLARALDDPPPPPPADYKGPWTPPPAPWVKRSFTVTVPELPASLPLYLGGLPGVIVENLTYSGASPLTGLWTIEGVIYENRI